MQIAEGPWVELSQLLIATSRRTRSALLMDLGLSASGLPWPFGHQMRMILCDRAWDDRIDTLPARLPTTELRAPAEPGLACNAALSPP